MITQDLRIGRLSGTGKSFDLPIDPAINSRPIILCSSGTEGKRNSMAIARNNVRFLVIPAKAGIQNLDPGSKPALDHDPGSGVTGTIPVNWTRILAIGIKSAPMINMSLKHAGKNREMQRLRRMRP